MESDPGPPPQTPAPVGGLAARKGRSEVAAIVAVLLLLLGIAGAAFAGGHKYGPHWGGGHSSSDCYYSSTYCGY